MNTSQVLTDNMQALHPEPLHRWENTNGFIRNWFLTGFFPTDVTHGDPPSLMDPKQSSDWETDLLIPWGGEASITKLPETKNITDVEWAPVQSDCFEQKCDLQNIRLYYPSLSKAIQHKKESQWYALCLLESQKDQTLDLYFGVEDGARLFFNGDLLFEEHCWQRTIYDHHHIQLHFKKGINTLLFKKERDSLVARIVDKNGNTPEGLHVLAGDDTPDYLANDAHAMRLMAQNHIIKNPLQAQSTEAFLAWQSTFHSQYLKALGAPPEHLQHPSTTAEILEEKQCDGYLRRRVLLQAEQGLTFEACVLIPDTDRRNGKTVITPHGHRFLYNHVIGLEPEPQPRWSQLGAFDGNYNEQLAQAGFVTAAWCQRGFDNRKGLGEGDSCDTLARMAEIMGTTLPHLHIADLHRVADYVTSLEMVDENALGLGGLSGGATTSWLAGAYDNRFKAVASFCGTMRMTHWVNSGSCGMQTVPGIFTYGDTPDILALIAPRPLLIAQARFDGTFNILASKSIAAQTQVGYDALNASKHIHFEVFDAGHQFNLPVALSFFETNL